MAVQNTSGDAINVSNYTEWRDEFRAFDTTNNWELVQNTAGAAPSASGTTGGARWLNIPSGTAAGETILLSRRSFRLPLIARVALSMSQRIANQEAYFEIVSVDGRGNVETDTSIVASTALNDATNAAAFQWTSTTATNAICILRGYGCPELTSSAQTYGTTVGTGSPNWLPATVFDIIADNEKVSWVSRSIDGVGNALSPFNRTQGLLDPNKRYKIRIRIKNTATVTATDLRIHHVRVSEINQLSVDWQKQIGLAADASNSLPVSITNYAYAIPIGAGTAAIGDVGVQYRTSTTGAASFVNVLSPATPAAQTVKAGAGRLLGLTITNTNASARWLKIFNLLVGSVTPGTTAATAEIGLPPNSVVSMTLEGGIAFSTGITIMVTGAQGLTNNTVVTGGEVTGIASFA